MWEQSTRNAGSRAHLFPTVAFAFGCCGVCVCEDDGRGKRCGRDHLTALLQFTSYFMMAIDEVSRSIPWIWAVNCIVRYDSGRFTGNNDFLWVCVCCFRIIVNSMLAKRSRIKIDSIAQLKFNCRLKSIFCSKQMKTKYLLFRPGSRLFEKCGTMAARCSRWSSTNCLQFLLRKRFFVIKYRLKTHKIVVKKKSILVCRSGAQIVYRTLAIDLNAPVCVCVISTNFVQIKNNNN